MNITSKQWFQIVSGVISGLITGAALLTTLLGQELALQVVAFLGILNIIVSSIGTTLSGQGALVKEVAAMPGVEQISVNSKANTTLAILAADPNRAKIAATPQDLQAVTAIAKAG